MTRLLLCPLLLIGTQALACQYPDEGNLPLRRAVAQVKYLPEIEAWAQAKRKSGAVVQYAVYLDAPRREEGRCYWPVEVRAGGKLWRRFYVTPDGTEILDSRFELPVDFKPQAIR